MDNSPDAMDWRNDTPPKVFYQSTFRPPKRNREETPEEEVQLRQDRPNRFFPTESTPSNAQLPPIGNGYTRDDFLHLGQHELRMDDNYRRLNTRNAWADPPGANTLPIYEGRYNRMDESNLGRPPPRPAQEQSSPWWQSVRDAVAGLGTYAYNNIAQPIWGAGRYLYENRASGGETVIKNYTTFVTKVAGCKVRIIECICKNPQPPCRPRSPPRVVHRPHPHGTSTRIRLENEERERREALEAAAIDITNSGTRHFEPVMSGALQSPEGPHFNAADVMPDAIQSAINLEPIISGTIPPALPDIAQTYDDFHLAMPGAMPEDIIPRTDNRLDVFSETKFYDVGFDSAMSDTITMAMEAAKNDLSNPLDSLDNSDSEMEEDASEDTEYESPMTDDTDPEFGPPLENAQWKAMAELQKAHDYNDDSLMESILDIDEPSELPSELEISPTLPSAVSGLSDYNYSRPYQPSSFDNHEPQSSPLSDAPSDMDITPPASTPFRKSLKKSVGFYESPKTGRPVTRVKKYYTDEPMSVLYSSSPPEYIEEDSISSSVDSDESIFDDPEMHAAAAAYGRAVTQQNLTKSLALATNGDFPHGNPEPAGNIRQNVSDSTDYTEVEIAGSVGYTPTDDSLISRGSTDGDQIYSEIAGVVNYAPAAASLPIHGPVLAPIHNNQYSGPRTRRRSGTPSFMVTFQGSPIKKRICSPAISARSLSKVSLGSILMKENISPSLQKVSVPMTASAQSSSPANDGEHASPREMSTQTPMGLVSGGQIENSQKHDTATEGVATPDSQNKSSGQSTPPQDLETEFGSLRMSDRRHSSRRRKQEQEERKLREEQQQRAAEEKARKEKEEADAAAEKARLEKERAEEEVRLAKEAEEERKRQSVREIPVEKVIQPLTADWEAKVEAAMARQRNHVLAKTSTGTSLTRKDFGTLFPQRGQDPASGWLNDEIIMAYLQAVVDYGRDISDYKEGDIPKYHAFSTFFFKNIRDKGVQSVKRWAARAKIGGKNLEFVEHVFIPVHSGAHWTLLIVSPKARTIEYYDSMGGAGVPFTKAAREWLKQEMGKAYKEEEWNVVLPEGGGPQQSNGSDCGVFTVTTAKMVLLGIDPAAYSCEDIPLQRKRMVAELMNGGFTEEFEPRCTFGGREEEVEGSDEEEISDEDDEEETSGEEDNNSEEVDDEVL